MAYTVKVEYKKRFVSGILKGLVVVGTVPFPSVTEAQRFIKDVRGNAKNGILKDLATRDKFVPFDFRIMDMNGNEL